MGVVGVDLDIADDALSIDDKTAGHRQLPKVIAIEAGKVYTEAAVYGLEFFRQGEGEAEECRNLVVDIHQNGKCQIVFFNDFFRIFRQLW